MAKKPDEIARVDEVVEAALQLFMERGYDNAPMSLLARRLGLTKAGLYHHFDSKEDLLFIAHKTAMQRQLGPLFKAAEKEPNPERRLRTFLHDYARMLALEPTAGLMIREARRLSSSHLKEIKKTWRRGLDLIRGAIVALQRSGRCRTDVNPTFAAFAAIGMANWICYWFDPKQPDAADAVAKTIADLFMSGLTGGKDRRAPSPHAAIVAAPPHGRQSSRDSKEKRTARKRRSS